MSVTTYSKFLELVNGVSRTIDLSSVTVALGVQDLQILSAGSGSSYIGMSTTTGGTSYTVSWPANQGSANTYLKNDGSGNLSWSAAGTGTVTSVSFTGDGTILSSTPSSAVT